MVSLRRLLLVLFALASVVLTGSASAQNETATDEPDDPRIEHVRAFLRTYDSRRDKAENEAHRERALALADTLEAEGELALAAQCFERAGIVCYGFGEIDRAIVIWERGLDVARRSADGKRIAALLNAQAIGVSASGDNERALELLWDLLEVRRQNDDARGEGVTWHNLAYSQLALFQYPEAVESLRNAIRLHRQADNFHGLAVSYLTLAPRLEAYVHLDEALAIADSAVAIAERIDNPQYIGVARNNRGEMLHRDGRDQEALTDIERAIAVLEEAGAERFVGSAVMNRADVLTSLGRFEEADAAARRALPLLEEHGDPHQPLVGRAILGRVRMRAGDADEARTIFVETIAEFRALQDTLVDPVAQALANHAGGAVTYLALLHLRQDQEARAWRVVEEGLARGLGSELADSEDALTLDRFQAALAEHDAAALVYGLATVEGCPGFFVTGDDLRAFEVAYRGGIRRAHAEVVDGLPTAGADEKLDSSLQALADVLVEPALAHLPADVNRLVIVPGEFAGLPFEALPLSDGALLGDRFAPSYAPSATAFVGLENRTGFGTGVLALADPTAGDPSSAGPWAQRLRGLEGRPLPEARAEVAAVAPQGSRTLMGDEATPRAFRELAPAAAVVHVATHAIVDPANPGRSALVLAGKSGGSPVILAEEIEGLEMGADLVCLSGCATAGGYTVPGEGAFGLTRAFLVAGARTVVASWWQVEDRAGRRFMELFYAGLRDGLDRDVAAQRARARMGREGFGRRDRLAFAVVGAISGSMVETLGTGGRDRLAILPWLVVVASLLGVGLLWLTNRGRPPATG